MNPDDVVTDLKPLVDAGLITFDESTGLYFAQWTRIQARLQASEELAKAVDCVDEWMELMNEGVAVDGFTIVLFERMSGLKTALTAYEKTKEATE